MIGLEDRERWPGLDDVVEAFESALARDGSAEVADFAPAADHPDRLKILAELIRVDLEHRWGRGDRRPLEHYRPLSPGLFEDPELLRAVAFEEDRLRVQAGESPADAEDRRRPGPGRRDDPAPAPGSRSADEMERAAEADRSDRREGPGLPHDLGFRLDARGVSGEHASLLRHLDRTDPLAAESLADAIGALPRVGSRFLGFQLCGELGRGAFGRVYLARQGDLADRLVALKVSANVAGESHALSQLQHTNVVPIYSVHRRGALQAVCMPYLGSTTLADTLADLRGLATLPRSGEGLLSTHRRTVREPGDPSGPAAPPPDDGHDPIPPAPTPQVERLRGLGYVPAVLWLIERVADGLAHAHERGILHRDLKPANILFADDGEPLLLDFNLAADTKVRSLASAAMVGGTLPYMAPEQLEAFRDGRPSADPRSDVFALGVILHELLTGAHPFPARRGTVDAVLPSMIADRLGAPPDARSANPAVPRAVASIVRHTLEPDPARRYQTARAFRDDLRRQLDDLPLRHAPDPPGRERLAKWARRHPRLTSSTTVGLVAAAILIASGSAFAARVRHYRSVEAAESFGRLIEERREAVALLVDPDADPDRIREGMEVCRRVAGRYRVLDDRSWMARPLVASLPAADQARARESLGDILVRWGRASTWRAGPGRTEALAEASRRLDLAEESYGTRSTPRALVLARAELARASGRGEPEVRSLLDRAGAIPLRTPRERLEAVVDRVEPGERRTLLAFLDRASVDEPLDYANWMTLALCYARVRQFDAAAQSYGVAIAMAPRLHWAHFDRGLLSLENQDFSAALDDFDRVVALRPEFVPGTINRALAKLGMGDARGAIDDLTRSLEGKSAPTRAWFIRAKAREKLGDRAGARLDREEGMRRSPEDEASFVARALARLPRDPAGALVDLDAALALNPRCRTALQDKASVLSENLGRVDEAIGVLDLAIRHHPRFVPSIAGRGVLLARLGRRDAALRDAKAALALDDRPLNLYQVACIYALTAKQEPVDATQALRLLSEAIRADDSWLAVIPKDRDLDPIRERPEFLELIRALTIVREAGVPHR